jgi:carboxymethylenebutenolidase
MRWLKRILLFTGVFLLTCVLFLALSIAFDALTGRSRMDTLANIQIPNPNGAPVAGFVAQPQTDGVFPAVIMIHEFWGLKDDIIGKAKALADQGYVVVAPDTYRGQTTGWLPRAIYLALTANDERVNSDLDAVFAWLASQPNVDPQEIIVVGFCYGGGKALRYSLHNPEVAGTGVFYGSLISDPEMLAALPGPVLGIFGALDGAPSPQDVAAFKDGLTKAGVAHQITVYPGVGHAFVKSMEEIRQGGVQLDAWNEFLNWLRDSTS